ncbi:MAG: reverse transcriptase-like protein [Candidatus Roizmanbacteria bacterium]
MATNNTAEYMALIKALEYAVVAIAKDPTISKLECFADSELMVRQVTGIYKVKHPDIAALMMRLKNVKDHIVLPIEFKHILREKNTIADDLVNDIYERIDVLGLLEN